MVESAPVPAAAAFDVPRVRMRHVLARIAPPVVVAIVLLFLWFVLSLTVFAGRGYLVPSPQDVAAAWIANGSMLLAAASTTFQEALLGFLAAIVLGVGTSALLSQSRLAERGLYPYAVLLQTVPVVAVAPLIVVWFGYNQTSVIIISLILSIFPIINNTLLGLRSTSRNLVDIFKMHRSSALVTFIKLRLPNALPQIMAGLRISAGLSVIGAIVGEFIIGSGNTRGGLGVQIIFAQGRMYTSLLFAEIMAATFLGFFFFAVVSVAGDRLLSHWHESASSE